MRIFGFLLLVLSVAARAADPVCPDGEPEQMGEIVMCPSDPIGGWERDDALEEEVNAYRLKTVNDGDVICYQVPVPGGLSKMFCFDIPGS